MKMKCCEYGPWADIYNTTYELFTIIIFEGGLIPKVMMAFETSLLYVRHPRTLRMTSRLS